MKNWKRGCAGLAALMLLFAQVGVAYATENTQTTDTTQQASDTSQTPASESNDELTEEEKAAKELEEAINKAYAATVQSNDVEEWPQASGICASAGILMDVNSGAILFAKNIDEQHYPASITKIMTALVALENASLTDTITITDASVDFLEAGDASVGMRAGEQITLEEALYAVLLASANEVSYAVAESIGTNQMGGNYQTFIDRMNERAAELGCTGTHWVNANGLHDDQHYTTAHDMALIAAEALKHEEFRVITKTLEHTMPATNLEASTRIFQQNHKMLFPENEYYYGPCIGGKTGFTDQSQTTLVTYADNGNVQLVAVNLESYGARTYTDTKALMDYGFFNFTKEPLASHIESEKVISFDNPDAYVLLPKGVNFDQIDAEYSLDEADVGRKAYVTYTFNGQQVGRTVATVTDTFYQELQGNSSLQINGNNSTMPEPEEADSATLKGQLDRLVEQIKALPSSVKVGILIGIALIIIFIIWMSIISHIRKVKREKRRAEIEEKRRERYNL